jgi:hypothetical protein
MSRVSERKSFWIVVALFAMGVLFAIAQTVEWATDQTPGSASLGRLMSVLFSWAPIIAMAGLYHLCLWSEPARELARVASGVHKGQLPLEDLSHIAGINSGLTPVLEVLTEILTDLKQQKGAMSAVKNELRQRVAVKTESLER